jgi:hypothetical protein
MSMMEIGMLWFDDDPKKSLTQKIVGAADYYRHKYGCVPNICVVNVNALDVPVLDVGIVRVTAARWIMPGHLWIGMKKAGAK